MFRFKQFLFEPRLAGRLALLLTGLLFTFRAVDFGFGATFARSATALLAVAGAGVIALCLADGSWARRRLSMPLGAGFGAGAAFFGLKQLLIDTGRIHQSTDPMALAATGWRDLPLFIWTTIMGAFWLWTVSDRKKIFPLEAPTAQPPMAGPSVTATVLGLTAAGAAVRLWNLGKLGLWSDEGTVFIAAKNILKTGWPYLETGLLYLRDLPHLYLTAAGMELFGQNEFGLRLPAALAGTALIPITFWLAYQTLKRTDTALVAAAIVAFHPWMIEYSRFGRSYMLMIFWLYLGAWFLQSALASRAARFGLAGAGFLAALTHQVGQTALLLAAAALIQKPWRTDLKKLWPFAVILGGVLAFKFLFAYGYYYQEDSLVSISTAEAVSRRIPFGLPMPENLWLFLRVAPFFTLAAAVIGLSRPARAGGPVLSAQFLNQWFWLLAAALFFSKKEVSLNRGIVFIFPLLAMAAAALVVSTAGLLKDRKLRLGLLACIALIISAYLGTSASVVVGRDYGSKVNPNFAPFDGFDFYHDNKTTIQFVNRHRRPGDQIIVMGLPQYWWAYGKLRPDWRVWTGTTMQHKGRNIFTATPEIRDLDTFDKKLRGRRTWIVTSYSVVWTPRVAHIRPEIGAYINSYRPYIKYQSPDKSAAVYLIDKTAAPAATTEPGSKL